MRKNLIAANWKMHGSHTQATSLIDGIKAGIHQQPSHFSNIDIAIFPPFIYLSAAHHLLADTHIDLGAQNLYIGTQGAFTGEISGSMLIDVGCAYVLVGHSERRHIFHEDLSLVANKFMAAQEAGLKPILCVGESQAERKSGKTEAVIRKQLQTVFEVVGCESFAQAVIAYEPIWAIGTGVTATPDQAQAVHAFIRQFIMQNNVDIANTIRILYGGSMKPDNAAALMAMPDIDGGLIGGASLDAASFLQICAAAEQQTAIHSKAV